MNQAGGEPDFNAVGGRPKIIVDGDQADRNDGKVNEDGGEQHG